MEIDIASPEGTTIAALAKASALMLKAGRDNSEVMRLHRAVFSAGSAKEARDAITKATSGAITFVDSSEG